MGNIPSKTKEPKASIIHGLIEKRPAQDVIVTAIQQLYSKRQIMGFIDEYAVMLSKQKVRGQERDHFVGTEARINRAFERFKDSQEFSGPIREKWKEARGEVNGSRLSTKLSDLLRGGRKAQAADSVLGMAFAT